MYNPWQDKGDYITRDILGGIATVFFTKKSFGDMHPLSDGFDERFKELREIVNYSKFFFPSLDGTNMVFSDEKNVWEETLPGLYRTKPKSDGVVSSHAMGMFNADCPAGVIHFASEDRKIQKLMFLHVGLNSLARDKPITDAIFEQPGLRVKKAWYGCGIGPCCYGLSRRDDRLSHAYFSIKKATKGPRKGQVSVDLADLFGNQLMNECSIELDDICTACSGDHFSNVYAESLGENPKMRNAFVVRPNW